MKTRKSKKKRIIITGEPTPELFQMMVEEHDPTYLWSENDAHIKAERIKEEEILKARAFLGDQIAVPIWNQLMRKKVVPSFVKDYLWNVALPNKSNFKEEVNDEIRELPGGGDGALVDKKR